MNDEYQATGPGSEFLKYPILQFILTSEPFLGTAREGIPDGPFNRELVKLLKNDEALASLFVGYLNRTFGVISENAPAIDTIPDPLVGAPATPANLQAHSIYFLDFEVFYAYDGINGVWLEKARQQRSVNIYQQHTATLTVDLGDGSADVVMVLPTVDDDGNDFTFTLSDVKSKYVDVLDVDCPIISLLLGKDVDDNIIRPVLTDAPTPGDTYNAVLRFERLVKLA